jgi:16S rRNA G966 N2-methylase RsmD
VLGLKQNISNLQLESVTKILPVDAFQALRSLVHVATPYSFVYIDPPYALIEPLQGILQTIDSQLPLAPGASIFLETRRKAFTPQPLPSLPLISHRTSGDSDLWEFAKE